MEQTLAKVLALDPDRVSCYSYAHLPEIFSSQRSVDRMALPSADETRGAAHHHRH
jgi:oxygen-independent coproporphyrinogen-3 oxidase